MAFWAIFDLATIAALATGIYLWIKRRNAANQQWVLMEESEKNMQDATR
ncbi:hypothetical protein [Chitinophaga sp. 212800010-3]